MATLSFGFILEEVFARWESVTGGNAGKTVGSIQLLGYDMGSGTGFYFVSLAITVACTLGILNLLRAPTGRAFVAIRDSEISAQSMGIHLAYYKTLSFSHVGGAWRVLPVRCTRTTCALFRPTSSTCCNPLTCC